ncbi:MAG: Twin-arginine translocation protein TatC, partial [uncultured Solirubrobacteraceae bacterium]
DERDRAAADGDAVPRPPRGAALAHHLVARGAHRRVRRGVLPRHAAQRDRVPAAPDPPVPERPAPGLHAPGRPAQHHHDRDVRARRRDREPVHHLPDLGVPLAGALRPREARGAPAPVRGHGALRGRGERRVHVRAPVHAQLPARLPEREPRLDDHRARLLRLRDRDVARVRRGVRDADPHRAPHRVRRGHAAVPQAVPALRDRAVRARLGDHHAGRRGDGDRGARRPAVRTLRVQHRAVVARPPPAARGRGGGGGGRGDGV